MKLSTVRRILKENLGGDLPAWLERVLDPLNQFMEQIYIALSKGLTFSENFNCSVVKQTITHATALEINPQAKTKVSGVLLISSSGQTVSGFGWTQKTNGNIAVTVQYLAGGTTKAECQLVILLG